MLFFMFNFLLRNKKKPLRMSSVHKGPQKQLFLYEWVIWCHRDGCIGCAFQCRQNSVEDVMLEKIFQNILNVYLSECRTR